MVKLQHIKNDREVYVNQEALCPRTSTSRAEPSQAEQRTCWYLVILHTGRCPAQVHSGVETAAKWLHVQIHRVEESMQYNRLRFLFKRLTQWSTMVIRKKFFTLFSK